MMDTATLRQPNRLRWAALSTAAVGMLCLLVFYEAFGQTGRLDVLFALGWVAIGVGTCTMLGATLWAWKRQEHRRAMFVIMVFAVVAMALLLMAFPALFALGA